MANRFPGLLHLLPRVLLIAVLVLVPSLVARAQEYRIQATASPARMVFGEDNNVTLRVSVTDAEDRNAPEGTAVYFHTTLGTLPAVAYTRNGQVSALLENTQGPGRAIVTITAGAGQRILYVEYLGEGGEAAAPVGRVSYSAKAIQVYYSMDQRVLDLCDLAQFTTPTFTVNASRIQFDVKSGLLKAQYGVTLTADGKSLTGESLFLETNTRRGAMRAIDPDIRHFSFTLPLGETKEDDYALNADYRPLDPLPTNTWIICREVTIFPNEQLQFRRPEFYLNKLDRRLFKLPYHVLDLRASSAGSFFNSTITLTSDAGLNIDFPIYYAATDSRIGSIHLRNVTKGSSFFKGSAGVQVSLEEEYLVGENGDGSFYLDDITRPTRSASWDHAHTFGATRVYANVAYDRNSADIPYTTRLGLSLSRPLGAVHTTLYSNWSEFKGNENGIVELKSSLPTIPLGGRGFRLGFSPYLGYTRAITAATETQVETLSENFYQGVVANLGIPTVNLLGGVISTNISDEISHEKGGEITNYFDAGVNYRRRLSNAFSLSTSYAYGISHSNRDTVSSEPSQRISLDISGSRLGLWSLYSYASYDLQRESLYGSADLTYYLPFERAPGRDPVWFTRYKASVNVSGSTTADHLFSLGRKVGKYYTAVLHYSPTGNTSVTGIGSGTGKKWAVELVRQGW